MNFVGFTGSWSLKRLTNPLSFLLNHQNLNPPRTIKFYLLKNSFRSQQVEQEEKEIRHCPFSISSSYGPIPTISNKMMSLYYESLDNSKPIKATHLLVISGLIPLSKSVSWEIGFKFLFFKKTSCGGCQPHTTSFKITLLA